MSSMQEELSTFKAKDIRQNAQTTEPSMNQTLQDNDNNDAPTKDIDNSTGETRTQPVPVSIKPSQKERNAKNWPNRKKQTKTTKTKISIIGDSNTRRLNSQLNNKDRCADYTVWTNAGCRMQDLESRAHDMISGSDVGVIHLGTLDALSEDSDNDCLSGCSDGIDRIHDSTGNIPLVVCALPPTNNKRGQRRVNMIYTLLDYKCRTNSKLQFLNSKLTLQDISGDGIHLNETGYEHSESSSGFSPHSHLCTYVSGANSTVVDNDTLLNRPKFANKQCICESSQKKITEFEVFTSDTPGNFVGKCISNLDNNKATGIDNI